MGVHGRLRPALLGGLLLEAAGAEDVVDVVVGVDGRGERVVRAPRAHGVVQRVVSNWPPVSSMTSPSPVSIVLTDGDPNERQDAGRDLLGRPAECRPHRMVLVDEVALAVPVPLGQSRRIPPAWIESLMGRDRTLGA